MFGKIARWIMTPLAPSWGCGKCGSTYDTHDEAHNCWMSH